MKKLLEPNKTWEAQKIRGHCPRMPPAVLDWAQNIASEINPNAKHYSRWRHASLENRRQNTLYQQRRDGFFTKSTI